MKRHVLRWHNLIRLSLVGLLLCGSMGVAADAQVNLHNLKFTQTAAPSPKSQPSGYANPQSRAVFAGFYNQTMRSQGHQNHVMSVSGAGNTVAVITAPDMNLDVVDRIKTQAAFYREMRQVGFHKVIFKNPETGYSETVDL